ncbi:hypothetical protein NSB20_20370 [Bacteroides acidifaciens]|uniref:hypothetical protein n=1 Tax=Bacteroides acidifaciens TaxID=85831 RepID=UPI002149B398|nr:hypothetical protein [Bacteroides acidifaciens]MCR2007815.1 hypothetical protein [Bacteroides acidifaciens]
MESLVERVFTALKSARLIKSGTIESVKESGLVFTRAIRNQEIKDALSGIDDLSLSSEYFSGFSNGIVFTIKPLSYK